MEAAVKLINLFDADLLPIYVNDLGDCVGEITDGYVEVLKATTGALNNAISIISEIQAEDMVLEPPKKPWLDLLYDSDSGQ